MFPDPDKMSDRDTDGDAVGFLLLLDDSGHEIVACEVNEMRRTVRRDLPL